MGHNNREIEKKYVVTDDKLTYTKVLSILNGLLIEDADLVIKGASGDDYWHPINPNVADFMRVRSMPDGTAQLTVKHCDRGSTLNRVEVDVPVTDPAQAIAFLKQIAGEPAGNLFKKYTVFFMDKKDTNISMYKITGDSRVFVEIEARSVAKVDKLYKAVNEVVGITQEPRSLYQIFFGVNNEKPQ